MKLEPTIAGTFLIILFKCCANPTTLQLSGDCVILIENTCVIPDLVIMRKPSSSLPEVLVSSPGSFFIGTGTSGRVGCHPVTCTHFRRKCERSFQYIIYILHFSITYKCPHCHSPLKCLFVRLPHAKHPQVPNLDNGILPLYPQSFGIEAKIEDDNGDERPQKS